MAQIIKHRRGSLEALSAVTSSLQKGELVIASGSSNLTVTNGSSLVFAVPENGQVQATNRFLMGDGNPATFAGSTYNGMVKGVPYYASGSSTLYLLGTDANEAINLVGNIQPFSQSVAASINSLSSSIGSGTIGSSVTQLNAFTASAGIRLANLESTSASVNGHIVDINAYTASNDTTNTLQTTRIDQLAAATASVNNFTSSATIRLNNLESTSASVNGHITAINAWSASAKTSISDLESKAGTLETYTASIDSKISSIHSYTSSLKTALTASGANVIFSGDVTIPGNLTVSGTQTIVDSTTVQIGDNIIELNGSGAANGGLWVKDATNPNTATGSIVWDSTNDYWKAGVKGSEIKVLLAGGDSVVSGSSQIDITATTGYSTFSSSVATSISASDARELALSTSVDSRLDSLEASLGGGGDIGSSVTQLNAFTGSQSAKNATLATYTASVDSRLGQLETNSGSQASQLSNLQSFSGSQETKNATLATYTASVDSHISNVNAYTASNTTTNDAQNTRLTTLEAFTGSQETKNSTLATYTASVDSKISQLIADSGSQAGRLTSLESFSGSQNTKNATLATYTASIDVNIANIHTFTSSFGTTFSSSVDSRLDTLEGTGTIQGVGTSNEVTFAKVTTTGDVIVGGDLVVQGNTTTLNTAQLIVEDKLITLASGSTSNATADGAGFEVAGTSASFKYDGTNNQFSSSVNVVANVTGSLNVPGFGTSKRAAFRNAAGNIDFVAAPTNTGDLLQWDGTDFVMSNTIDGGSF